MQIALFILLIISSGAAGVFAFSLRKYQNKLFEQAVQNKKSLEDSHSLTTMKEQELSSAKIEIEHMATQLSEHNMHLKSEKTNAFNDGLKQGSGAQEELKTKLTDQSTQVKSLKLKVQTLTDQSEVSKLSNKIRSKTNDLLHELVDTTRNCLQNNLLRQQEIAHNKNISLIPNKISKSYSLSFDYILANSRLVENQDYLIDKLTTEDNVEKCHYTVFIISNETVILVDNKLAIFFEENTNAFESSDPKVITQINDIIEERIKFLSNTKLQDNIKEIVSNLDSVIKVKEFIAGIYVPSEMIFNDLLKPDFDFFRKINKAKIKPLVPASIVSIVKSAEASFLLEDALVSYKIVEDIAHDIDQVLASTPETKGTKVSKKLNPAASITKPQDDYDVETDSAPKDIAKQEAKPKTLDNDDDLDLNFDDVEADSAPKDIAKQEAKPKTLGNDDDLDLNFDDVETDLATKDIAKQEAKPKTLNNDDDLDLNFDDITEAPDTPIASPPSEDDSANPEGTPQSEDFNLDFDDQSGDLEHSMDSYLDNPDILRINNEDVHIDSSDSLDEPSITNPGEPKKENFKPEIKIDPLDSEEMSDQNTIFKSETNADQIKAQSSSNRNGIDQLDIGGFLDNSGDDSAEEPENKSDEATSSSESSSNGSDIDDFLKS